MAMDHVGLVPVPIGAFNSNRTALRLGRPCGGHRPSATAFQRRIWAIPEGCVGPRGTDHPVTPVMTPLKLVIPRNEESFRRTVPLTHLASGTPTPYRHADEGGISRRSRCAGSGHTACGGGFLLRRNDGVGKTVWSTTTLCQYSSRSEVHPNARSTQSARLPGQRLPVRNSSVQRWDIGLPVC